MFEVPGFRSEFVPTMEPSYVAIDLGASSGRVVCGRFGPDAVDLETVHRFPNEPYRSGGHERWNIRALVGGITAGLARLPDTGAVRSIGVDTWGVDYGLLDASGHLIDDPVCYRDQRTDGFVERVLEIVPRDELFRLTGIQVQPFNTIYQLVAERRRGEWPRQAARLLMIPDIIHHHLCGAASSEVTMASTTQLASAATREWIPDLFARLDVPFEVMPRIVQPGTPLGTLTRSLQHELRLPAVRIVTPATHDTASAVAGTPLEDGWAYLSSGTWSLLGVEIEKPLVAESVAAQNLTNEAGVEGSNRLLKNIMGLWILESCRRVWGEQTSGDDYSTLMDAVAQSPAFLGAIDPDDRTFFHPPNMVDAVRSFLRETGQRVPDDRPTLVRIILESLALRYAEVIDALATVTGRSIRGIRIIGGGSQNRFLNQATADACGLEVRAGPVEATALGNVTVQAIADGRFASVAEARRHIGRCLPAEHYEPTNQPEWARARERFASLTARSGR